MSRVTCTFRGQVMTDLVLDPDEFRNVRTAGEAHEIIKDMVAVSIPDVTWDDSDIRDAAELVMNRVRSR